MFGARLRGVEYQLTRHISTSNHFNVTSPTVNIDIYCYCKIEQNAVRYIRYVPFNQPDYSLSFEHELQTLPRITLW
jgi:hypothetical protein